MAVLHVCVCVCVCVCVFCDCRVCLHDTWQRWRRVTQQGQARRLSQRMADVYNNYRLQRQVSAHTHTHTHAHADIQHTSPEIFSVASLCASRCYAFGFVYVPLHVCVCVCVSVYT